LTTPTTETPAPAPLELSTLARSVEAGLAGWLGRRPLPENLRGAIDYALSGPGKRIRPALAILSCRAAGGSDAAAMPAAAALELVHTFSLVHDDLPAMDDDDLRRGRPALHRHAGEALAILAGDAMQGLAFELLASEVRPAARAGELCRELSQATNDMIAGQVCDTTPAFPADLPPLERLRTTHRLKTGALIRAACRMGAISAGAGDEALERLGSFGSAVGLMFQIVDDLLDVTQSTEHLGKTARKDERQAKLTYPALVGIEGSLEEVERLCREALARIEPFGARARPLAELCERLAARTR
jgi:geranylgeranyl diphosphate synthase type II